MTVELDPWDRSTTDQRAVWPHVYGGACTLHLPLLDYTRLISDAALRRRRGQVDVLGPPCRLDYVRGHVDRYIPCSHRAHLDSDIVRSPPAIGPVVGGYAGHPGDLGGVAKPIANPRSCPTTNSRQLAQDKCASGRRRAVRHLL